MFIKNLYRMHGCNRDPAGLTRAIIWEFLFFFKKNLFFEPLPVGVASGHYAIPSIHDVSHAVSQIHGGNQVGYQLFIREVRVDRLQILSLTSQTRHAQNFIQPNL